MLNYLDEKKLVKQNMEIIESQMEFKLDQRYSHDLKSFVKNNAITRIKGFIENFLEKDLKERKNAEFKDFKEEFEEYFNCGEVYESDISGFSIEEQIEICQEADDFGILFLGNSKITYKELRPMIARDCGFALNQLINQECFDFVGQLENSMKEMNLTTQQLTDDNNLGYMAHKKELEPNRFTQVYCYRCVEGEMDLNIDVYELRFSGFRIYFEKSVEIPLKEQERNLEEYEVFGP